MSLPSSPFRLWSSQDQIIKHPSRAAHFVRFNDGLATFLPALMNITKGIKQHRGLEFWDFLAFIFAGSVPQGKRYHGLSVYIIFSLAVGIEGAYLFLACLILASGIIDIGVSRPGQARAFSERMWVFSAALCL